MTLSGPPDELERVAAGWADTVVAAVRREYPNATGHVMTGPDDQITPRSAHPAFYGCYDWHSAVEMHWTLVRLLRVVPESIDAYAVREVLDEHLTADALAAEARYLGSHPGWERPYGYGWVLALAGELASWAEDGDPDAARWSDALALLADIVTDGLIGWLDIATYPQRTGTHANSAFALCRSLPYARRRAVAGDRQLLTAISSAAVRWFAEDVDYPAGWEPSGSHFLSGALAEAELIGELATPPEQFPLWLSTFLPGLAAGRPASLFEPVVVSDPTDGQIAHLYGLNLHRAYAFDFLADRLAAIDSFDPRVPVLRAARDRHAAVSLPRITGTDWMVEHWLAAYAVLLLT